MSRKKFTLKDFDQYLKPVHLGGKPQTYTVTHTGVIAKQAEREFVFAGENPEELERGTEDILVLHFAETKKKMRLTSGGNRAKIGELIGDSDIETIIGAKVTVKAEITKGFGKEYLAIIKIELAKVQRDPKPYRTERLKQLSALRMTEKELLIAQNLDQKPLLPATVAAMEIEEIERLVEQTESNIADLRANAVTEIK